MAINLASVLSLGEQKVVLVGMDLRKPKIFNDFGLSNETGLSNYLAGHNTKDEIIQKTTYNNLSIISGGVVPPNPSELIQSERFEVLMNELKDQFDYVVLDTPPIGLWLMLFKSCLLLMDYYTSHVSITLKANFSGLLTTSTKKAL